MNLADLLGAGLEYARLRPRLLRGYYYIRQYAINGLTVSCASPGRYWSYYWMIWIRPAALGRSNTGPAKGKPLASVPNSPSV